MSLRNTSVIVYPRIGDTDINTQLKKSNENPFGLSLYENLLKGREHKLPHRDM